MDLLYLKRMIPFFQEDSFLVESYMEEFFDKWRCQEENKKDVDDHHRSKSFEDVDTKCEE
jgi:hypothetical protein